MKPLSPLAFALTLLPLTACGAPPPPDAPPPGEASGAIESAPSASPVSPSPAPAPAPAVAEVPAPPPAPPPPCAEGAVLVPGGSYKTAAGRAADVGPLCVDVTETTAAQYAECASAGACSTEQTDCAAQSTFGKPDKAEHPMVCVDFSQALAYCAHRGKRLPTTEEWEWIARSAGEARRYPWGDDKPSDQLCWTGVQKQTGACRVGSFPTGDSAQGVKDLAGNVLEFTTTAQDPKSPVRIARGGSWRDGAPELVRIARLGGFALPYRCAFLGIRCVDDGPVESNSR